MHDALMAFGKWLTALVYGGKYTEFAYLLPLMALPVVFQNVSSSGCQSEIQVEFRLLIRWFPCCARA